MLRDLTLAGRRDGTVTGDTTVIDNPQPGILAEVEVRSSRPFPWGLAVAVVVLGAIVVALMKAQPEPLSRRT